MDGPDRPFVHIRRISWGDTDAARIVYTARVPHFAMEAIEAWFLERLGAGWFEMNLRLGYGTPFVHMEIDFRSPMTPDDTIATAVLLERLGRSSLGFYLVSRAGERVCWTGRFRCAFVGKEFRSMAIPERYGAALAREAAIGRAALPDAGT